MHTATHGGLFQDLRAVPGATLEIRARTGCVGATADRAPDMGDVEGRVAMVAVVQLACPAEGAGTVRIAAPGQDVISDWVAERATKGLDGAQLVEDAHAAVVSTVRHAAPGS